MNPVFTIKQRRNFIALALTAAWLYTFSLLYQLFFTNTDNPRKITGRIENYLHRNERDFEKLSGDTALLLRLFNQQPLLKEVEELGAKDYTLLVYDESFDSSYTLRFWNNCHALPQQEQLVLPNGYYPLERENGYFEYIRKTVQVNDTRMVVAAMVPLYWSYFIENEYLKKSFPASPLISRRYTASAGPEGYAVKNGADNKVVMYIQEKADVRNTGYSRFVVITRLLSVFVLVLLLLRAAGALAGSKKFSYGLLLLAGGLLGLHFLFKFTPFPFQKSRLEFFDPKIYASGYLFPSLASLVIDTLFFIIVVLFVRRRAGQAAAEWGGLLKKKPLFTGLAAVLVLTAFTLFTARLIRSIIADSTIPFDVTNFFNLTVYSVFGLATISMLAIAYYHVSQMLLYAISRTIHVRIIKYAAVALAGLLILYLGMGFASHPINIFVLLWLLLLLGIHELQLWMPARHLFSDNILWLIFFSASVCILFNYETEAKEMAERRQVARKLSEQSDPKNENLLRVALLRFSNLYLQQNFGRFYNDSSGRGFKRRLVEENFVGYLNKYKTDIYTYDSTGRPLANPDTAESSTWEKFNSLAQNQAQPVPNIPGLYFIDSKTQPDEYDYLYLKEVQDTGLNVIGYFAVRARPMLSRSRSTELFPELFKERVYNHYERANNYIYGVYRDLLLRKRFTDYEFPVRIDTLDIPRAEDTLKNRNGYQELWHRIDNASVVVVVKRQDILLNTVTIFAYLFFSFLLIWLLAGFLEKLAAGQINRAWLKAQFQFAIRKQVQGIIVSASLLAFVVIGASMISLFKARFDKNNRLRLTQSMAMLQKDVTNLLGSTATFDDEVNIFESGGGQNELLEAGVKKLEEIHQVDFNIYGTDGRLRLTSQPYFTNRGVVSDRIDPMAYNRMKSFDASMYVHQERIGRFGYLSMYVPVYRESEEPLKALDDKAAYSRKRKPIGYLNIPYYQSGADLRQEISNFLLTIINLNAFIFLVAGLMAWLITNRITRSFTLIGDKMKEVNLGKNEMIVWNRADEIGGLVNEYNKMVQKLEASAAALAKSEREGAWREMARQVAHEIKNPLTPMKLSIQYLQRAIESGSENVKELTASVTRTLVEQIDHLSNIAADFSQFANIVKAKNERFNLHEMLQGLQLLFGAGRQAQVELDSHETAIFISADKTHINRLFTNLIQNALQAYPPDAEKRVHIRVEALNGHVTTAVRDFGVGIPEDQREKIFTPNFTTKSSGTGLGLAISKGIAEQAHGRIWFESEIHAGTTFFVELPVDGD